ncbi:MAG: hypothetical protein H0T79_04505 [Deltaproteobacteria bacterium]|nr:hypothetical protein [Deltaproteobacteria bacterium]
MRCVGFVVLAAMLGASAQGSRAEVIDEPEPKPDPDRGNFWRDMLDPNAEEVAALVVKTRAALDAADRSKANDLDATSLELRARVYRDVFNILTYARRLSPENLAVLTLLGRAADETGQTRHAIDALQTITQLTGPEKADAEVTGRLGSIYLRLGQLDDAIRWLRIAQATSKTAGPDLIHLASALALRGDSAGAIDVLANATPTAPSYYAQPVTLINFALAVHYDRDEQRGAAFEVLDRLKASLAQTYGPQLQHELATFRFAPAEDAHYFHALFYESLGAYAEARAAWVLYAAGDAPYRRRALEHVAQLDTLRRARPGPHIVPVAPLVNPAIHRRIKVP